jgi:hypothetical protein
MIASALYDKPIATRPEALDKHAGSPGPHAHQPVRDSLSAWTDMHFLLDPRFPVQR